MKYAYYGGLKRTTISQQVKTVLSSAVLMIIVFTLSVQSVLAAGTVTVRTGDLNGWAITNEDLGAKVEILNDDSTPFGQGSLKFSTGPDSNSKAQISKLDINIPLSNVSEVSYWTNQNAGNRFGYEIPAYQMRLDVDGTGQYVTDFYSYPSYNKFVDPTLPDIMIDTWQKWDVFVGKWATPQHTFSGTFDAIPELTPGEGGIGSGIAGAGRGGGEFYSISDILRKYPSAHVVGIGASLGVFYEDSISFADGISINNIVYDFEFGAAEPTENEDCIKNDRKVFNKHSSRNRGRCTDFVKQRLPRVEGKLFMSNPSQKIKFGSSDNDGRHKQDDNNRRNQTVEYWNFDYPGVLHYKADVLCTGGDKATGEARVMFQVPAGHSELSGLYIVSYVKESHQKNVKDLYGHASTTDLATATQWCHTGVGFSPTMYVVTKGEIEVH